jgi:hypothetical protein
MWIEILERKNVDPNIVEANWKKVAQLVPAR